MSQRSNFDVVDFILLCVTVAAAGVLVAGSCRVIMRALGW